MKCEFCGELIEDGAVSCVHCGSIVRNGLINDKGGIVISLQQQSDIGNYKMSSEYKARKKDEEIIYDRNGVVRTFETQTISSENALKKNINKGDVLIGDDTENSSSTDSYDNALTENTNNAQKVRLQKNSTFEKKWIRQSQQGFQNNGKTDNHTKKISLIKESDVKNKKSNNFSSNSFIPIFGDNEEQNYYNSETQKIERDYATLPPGLTKLEFLKQPPLHSVRMTYFLSLLVLYAGILLLLIMAILQENPYGLIEVMLIILITFGMQFKISYACAIGCFIYGLFSIITGILFLDRLTGIPIFVAGLIAVISMYKFNNLWKHYLTNGIVPYR